MVDLVQDVWHALRSRFSVAAPGSCLARNEPMEDLRKIDSAALIDAIETVVTSHECAFAVCDEWIVQQNIKALFEIYFRLADKRCHDTIPLMDRLSLTLRIPALLAVYRIWGPGGYNRLNRIPKPLFDYFCQAIDIDSQWVEVLNRYQRIGVLEVA